MHFGSGTVVDCASRPRLELTYVLPLRRTTPVDEPGEGLDAYLAWLSALAHVVVVDGSGPTVFGAHHRRWSPHTTHVPVAADHRGANGKVAGVLTGLGLASTAMVVIADDDVRWDEAGLRRAVDLLGEADVVRPQNYFQPLPWHARVDTGRTLVNRAVGRDYPGTLAVRASALTSVGGYDGDVMFENLELLRTVRAGGGREVAPLDLYVRRLPPSTRHFLRQRVRQAFDNFALPARMAVELALLPCSVVALHSRHRSPLLGGATCVIVGLAEIGRRRAGGRAVFPASCSVLAPVWVAERSVCAWLAVGARLRGGVRYGDGRVRRAATSPRVLRARVEACARASGVS